MTDRSDTLTVMTWNLRRGSAQRWAHVAAMAPDIAVLQECAQPAALRRVHPAIDIDWTLFWTGGLATMGLLVAVRGDLPARLHAEPDPSIIHALAVDIGGALPIRLLAVHSYNHRAAKQGGSPTPLPDALAQHSGWLKAPSGMVVGDFNNEPSFERYNTASDRKPNRWSAIAATLDGLGLASAWHHLTGEAHGAETRPTHHHSNKGYYHIDYIYAAPERLAGSAVSIGDAETWIARHGSDHAPVILTMRCDDSG